MVLPIAPPTYHARVACRADPAKGSARSRCDDELRVEIRRVHAANFGVYGVRKVWRQLGRECIPVARCKVARLMRQMGLPGMVRGRSTRRRCRNRRRRARPTGLNRQFRVRGREADS